ncbi:MAG: bifunctional nuclease family protein [Ignavibacteriae bacterium]|nr:bifunctional nuclease family protein [Ignavibacteriota bacterium]MCB9207485.1 bifunctional nuclease family protein [Ignavibacteriales bacterium]MCB9211324.1 bifunctional nuclease family protein [Ignavibacteriales bacterium]MCB9218716.1 bifunctional nuclease family protein [Ignavibacteriales bacterium]MCB9259278.1 bifunctional nuclease family protein [Ignavibacteriales bacterium]
MEKIQVDILGLSSSPSAGGAYALLLKESFGVRRLPIIIGSFEAQSIALEIEGIKPPRPLTHDLMKNLVDDLGGTVLEVLIDELRDNTFYAKIILEVSTLTNTIDARPSDAIALAVRTGCQIFVSEEVMRSAAFVPSSEDSSESAESFEIANDFETKQYPKQSSETKVASLQDQLREAIEKEDYERAAKLRDEINRLKGNN